MIATEIADLGTWAGGMGNTRQFQLDEPWNGFDHIAVTVIPAATGWYNAGWQIVGVNADGVVPGTTVEAIAQGPIVDTHTNILSQLGWTVTTQEQP
ncbi:hypothetical protein AXK57_21575 [Tsukamurella pulmonis]|uniref:hypothetical protein n=1 Tax=Tsukamurella pulmonis TaxID=47312 RepID=UPI000795D81E|nr:hypothetical protein [Tsukamurella pulmonis]KXP11676.1 hypothetical protein AXK57_21575 [Tsukamurella pulmonis]